jgi:hypothetical protein
MEGRCGIGCDDERFGLVATYAAIARRVGCAWVEEPRAWISCRDTAHIYERNEVEGCKYASCGSELVDARE